MAKFGNRLGRLLGTAGVACLAAQPMLMPSVAFGATSDKTEFHVTISLDVAPAGDYDASVDAGTSDDEQEAYEDYIRAFAEAVYQSTNGKHEIASVTVYPRRAHWLSADVQWVQNCNTEPHGGPSTYPNGLGANGVQIRMCTNWSGGGAKFATTEGKGYVLAHEWGHYAYGLFDEYAITNACESTVAGCDPYEAMSTDTESMSIMSRERNAVDGSNDWLEFSTAGEAPYTTYEDGGNDTAHARIYGEPAWETLTRDPDYDPKPKKDKWTFLPRTQYTELVAPTSSNWTVTNNLSGVGAGVEIIWAAPQVLELMLDSSASLNLLDDPTLLNRVKAAAKMMIDDLDSGVAIGVGTYNDAPTQEFAITEIPSPDDPVVGVRASAKAAVDSAGGTGGSDPYEAAMEALAQVEAYGGASGTKVVFITSDGDAGDADTATIEEVIEAYLDAGVSLITLGIGEDLEGDPLKRLAQETGGRYYSSAEGLADMQSAFLTAMSELTPTTLVAHASLTVGAASTESYPLLLDAGLRTARVVVSHPLADADIDLRLLAPGGADTGEPEDCDEDVSDVVCTFEVNVASLGAGEYTVEVDNVGGDEKDVSIVASARHVLSDDLVDIAVKFDDTGYPENLSLMAAVSKGVPLTGLSVTAVVTRPDGTTFNITLRDNGKNSDALPDDGYYTADIPYELDGTYQAVVTAANAGGSAQTTYEGRLYSAPAGDTGFEPTPASVTGDFNRIGVGTATVSGMEDDDHSNFAAVPGDCNVQGSTFSDNNLDIYGRIDEAGDIDCFFLLIFEGADEDIQVRATSLTRDMDPVIKIYDESGTTQLWSVDPSSTESSELGVVGTFPASLISFNHHVVTVEHEDDSATKGGYALSIGAPMFNDPAYEASDPTDDGGDDTGGGGGGSGGAFGPWSVIFAALLAVVGLRQRRTAA